MRAKAVRIAVVAVVASAGLTMTGCGHGWTGHPTTASVSATSSASSTASSAMTSRAESDETNWLGAPGGDASDSVEAQEPAAQGNCGRLCENAPAGEAPQEPLSVAEETYWTGGDDVSAGGFENDETPNSAGTAAPTSADPSAVFGGAGMVQGG